MSSNKVGAGSQQYIYGNETSDTAAKLDFRTAD